MNDSSERGHRRPLAALSLRHIHYFVTLSHTLNFRLAAESLAITTAALSASIKETERLIGAELFVRKGHQVTLSEAGRAVLPLAEHLSNTAANAIADMTRVSAERQQTVRIGLVPSVAGRVVHELAALRAQQPQYRFEFFDRTTPALVDDVEQGRVDFGIGVGDAVASAKLVAFKLMTDEVVAIVRKDDPLAQDRSLTWSQLAAFPIGHFIRGGVADLAGGSAQARRITVNATYQVTFTEALYALVREGFCVGLIPRLTAESLPDATLAWMPIVKPRINRDIVLIKTPYAPRTSAVARCIDHLKKGAARWK